MPPGQAYAMLDGVLWVASVVGVALVVLVLSDLFLTLLHPSGRGRLNRAVMEGVWWLLRRPGLRRAASITGPVGVASVVLLWLLLSIIGWALVYLPFVPGSFSYADDLQPRLRSDLLDAVYISTVTLATLGFGDIVPSTSWLRLLVPVQALTGFAVLTAAVTWIMQLYPALGRRRALASRLAALRRADASGQLRRLHPASASALLGGVTAELSRIAVDITHYPETAYFLDADDGSSLPATVGTAGSLAAAGADAADRDTRLGADVLAHVLDGFAGTLRSNLGVRGESTDDVLAAYTRSHGRA